MIDDENKVTEAAIPEIENSVDVEQVTDATADNVEAVEEPRKVDRVQKRIDRLTKEKYELAAENEYLKRIAQERPQAKEVATSLDRADYPDDKSWIEAIADQKAEAKTRAYIEAEKQKEAKAEAEKRQMTVQQKADNIFAEAAKLGDLDVEDFNEVTYTPAMSEAILESDLGAKIVFHLASNPEYAEKIAQMSPARQAAEIGKLEDRLEAKEPVRKSAAPSPIKPISGGGKTFTGLSDAMDADTWREARLKQMRDKYK